MRILLLLVMSTTLAAQGLPLIQTLHERAGEAWTAGNYDEAKQLYIDAALIAETHHQPKYQVWCLSSLAWLNDSEEWSGARKDQVKPLMDAALKLAIEIGDRELETNILDSVVSLDDTRSVERLDAELSQPWGYYLEYLVQEAMFEGDEKTLKLIESGLALIDARARAKLNKAEAVSLLEKAAADAAKLGHVRMQIALLEDALEYKPALADSLRKLYETRGAKIDLAKLDVRQAPDKAEGEARKQWETRLLAALDLATEAGDSALQESAARALQKLTGDGRWGVVADNSKRRARAELLAEGERARKKAELLGDDLTERLLAHAGDAEFDRLIKALGIAPAAPLSAEQKKKYTDALAKALADPASGGNAVLLADFANRSEAAGPMLRALKATNDWYFLTQCVQGLATADDVAILIELLEHKSAAVRNMAAAELFRLNQPGLEAKARTFVKDSTDPWSRAWMLGYLARSGDAEALKTLETTEKEEHATVTAEKAAVLMSLGYGSAYRTLWNLTVTEEPVAKFDNTLNRLPLNKGTTLVLGATGVEPRLRTRMLAKRRWGGRLNNAEDLSYVTLLYCMPQDRREARTCGTAELNRMEQGVGLGGEIADLFQWAAQHAGMGGAELDHALEPAEGDTPLTGLARAERETDPRQADETLTRTLVLLDTDPCGRARCRITATAGTAEIIDGALVVPFNWTYDVDWQASGILGALYKQVIGEISLSGLLQKATLNIPGLEGIAGIPSTGLNKQPVLRFPLPKKTGEGLADDVPMDRETVLTGTLDLTFNFLDNPGAMSFPVKALEIPKADKPDLVATELIIDPPMPEYGKPAKLTMIARNMGCSVKTDVLASAAFYARNPQGKDGWRNIFAFVFPALGWQPGEIRTFESRPLAVDGYYMNTYSYLYDPAAGDTQIKGGVDTFQQIEEMDDQNNYVDRELPLELPDDLAKPMAEAEALKALEQPLADLMAAQTMDELLAAYRSAANIIIPIEHQLPEILIMGRHLMARYEMKKAAIRAKEATEKLKQWQADGVLTRERIIEVRKTLEQCELDLLNSGAPASANALEKARNATLLANNGAGALDDLAKLREIAGLGEGEGPASGNTLKALDGVALTLVEAHRMITEGKADAGNLLDAASNYTEALGIATPGLSNLHRAMFQAEVEYATKGFEKSASVLDIISDMIANGDSKERGEKLRASVGEVERHMNAGPFNEDSLKNIAKGWIKDIPLVGKIADTLFSWK